jgi:hypothetical protein
VALAGTLHLVATNTQGYVADVTAATGSTLTVAGGGTLRMVNGPGDYTRFTGALVNHGTVEVSGGNQSHFTGSYEQSTTGRLTLELGTNSVPQLFADQTRLAGRLDVIAPAGFAPAPATELVLLSGTRRLGQFDALNLPALAEPLTFFTRYTAEGLRLVVREGEGTQVAPFITQSPRSQFLAPGSGTVLSVVATGSTPFSYQWYRSGSPLDGGTNPSLAVPASPDGTRTYAVEVSNAAGSTFSDPTVLTLLNGVIPPEVAVRRPLPLVPGDGTVIEVFNGVGDGAAPRPEGLVGLAATGVTRSPFVDFPRPGSTLSGTFDAFFAGATVPPESLRGLAITNFLLRTAPLLAVRRTDDLDPTTPVIELQLGVGNNGSFALRLGDTPLGSLGFNGFAYTWMSVAFEEEGLYPLSLLYGCINQSGGLELSWRTAAAPEGEIIPQAALYTSPELGDRLITFEEVPVGTVVADQFASLGVRLTTTGGVQVTDAKPERFVPVSPTRVLGDPAVEGAATGTVEFRFTGPNGTGTGVTDLVSFFLIDAEATGALVTAFDPEGAELHRSEHHGGAGTRERVTISRTNLARVVVTLGSGNDTVALDNFSFLAPRAYNQPPQLSGPTELEVLEGQTLSVQFIASDPDEGDTLGFALVPPVPAGVTLNLETGALTWTPDESQGPGEFTVRLRVSDEGAPPLTADHVLQVTVREVNQPPTLAEVGDRLLIAGDTLTLQLSATDDDQPAQSLTFNLVEWPAGATLTPQGLFAWTSPGGVNASFPVRVRVADDFNPAGTAETAFSIRVASAPDLVITRLEAPAEGETGASFNATYRESNLGTAPATGAWGQRIWISADNQLDAGDTLLGEYPFNGTVNPGQFIERTLQFRFPNVVGDYWLIAVADAGNRIGEGIEDNNVRIGATPLAVGAAYTATVATDFTTGPAGTPIGLSGTAQRRGGGPAVFELVNIHLKVRGTTRLLSALTDEQGRFSTTFRPLPGEAGDYTVGAAHPGEASAPVQDRFRLLGMEFAPAELAFDVRALGSATNPVVLRNLSEVSLGGLTVVAEDLPPTLTLNFTPPTSLAGNAEVPLDVELISTAEESISGVVTVRVLSTEGAVATLRLQVQTRSLAPMLAVVPDSLTAAMLRGDQTVVSFTVQNNGGRPTGPLNVLLPALPWLASATTSPLPSLAPGETANVSLLLTPAADVPPVVYLGNLVVTDGAASVNVPYSFACVSDALTSLRVEAVDEYTYYAEGAPRVIGTRVEVRDKFTGNVVTNGVTGADGTITFNGLREGYYDVQATATDHSDFRQTVLLRVGPANGMLAFLSRQTVKYYFTVEEVALEERSKIVIESVFETSVPVPVITVEPNVFDLEAMTQDRVEYEVKITNHGLIAAKDLELNFGSSSRFRLTPLLQQLGDLPARSSLVVPLVIERTGAAPSPGAATRTSSIARQELTPTSGPDNARRSAINRNADGDCPSAELLHRLICGPATNTYSVPIGIISKCFDGGGYVPVGHDGFARVSIRGGSGWGGGWGSGWGYGGNDGIGGGGIGGPSSYIGAPIHWGPPVPCDPCGAKLAVAAAISDCIRDFLPSSGPTACVKDTLGCAGDPDWIGCGSALVSCLEAVGKKVPVVGPVLTGLGCLKEIKDACQEPTGGSSSSNTRFARHGTDPTTFPGLNGVIEQERRLRAIVNGYQALFGDSAWFHSGQTTDFGVFLAGFSEAIAPDGVGGRHVTETERVALLAGTLPVGGDAATASRFLDRWNRSLDYESRGIRDLADVPAGESTDFIVRDQFRAATQAAAEAIALDEAEGFSDPLAAARASVDRLSANLAGAATGAICARVRLRLDQEAVQTRQGFRATLELVNDSGEPLEGVLVNLEVRDAVGALANGQFGIPAPELSNLADVGGTGVVAANTTGRATWTLIPGHEAAPSPEPATYFIGGEFSYVQQGVRVRIPLTAVSISVHPTPQLTLTYFHERDVRSDDPFTPEVEPSIPYSLAVLVKNTGFGAARNLRITSSQPKIIENDKGLLINFDLIATQVGTESLTPSLTADFGDVPPGGTRQGRWLFKSSLQGQFIEYSATFEHLGVFSEFPELASIQSVDIHELIHIVRATGDGDDGLPDFLVNDVQDDDYLPDTLHLSQGGTAPVAVVRSATFDGAPSTGDLEMSFAATAPAGWVYFRLPDFGNGDFRVARVLRADGSEVSFGDNVWTTDRTFVAGGRRPKHEFSLHILDHVPAAGPVTYRVLFNTPPTGDTTAPGSAVAPLPASSGPQIPVQWSGTDNDGGSGLGSFDVFVSVDGADFLVWQRGVTTRGAIYPGETGKTYAFYTVAVDNAGNREAAPATPDTTTTVNRSNAAPELTVLATLAVDEGTVAVFVATATDADAPADVLTFSLGTDAPPGAVINARTGAFTWPTGEGNGPGTNRVTVTVTDNGIPPLADSAEVDVIVREVNHPPVIAPLTDLVVNEGSPLTVMVEAGDSDLPAQPLTYRLGAPVPAGLTLNGNVIRWTPNEFQGPSTNRVEVFVSDGVVESFNRFRIIVRDVRPDFTLTAGRTHLFAGRSGLLPIIVDAGVDLTANFRVDLLHWATAAGLSGLTFTPGSGLFSAASLTPAGPFSYEAQLTLAPGAAVNGPQTAMLAFAVASDTPSGRVRVNLHDATATFGNTALTRPRLIDGRVIVIGREPVLEFVADGRLGVFGRPGIRYQLERLEALSVAEGWQPEQELQVNEDGLMEHIPSPTEGNGARFYRLREP